MRQFVSLAYYSFKRKGLHLDCLAHFQCCVSWAGKNSYGSIMPTHLWGRESITNFFVLSLVNLSASVLYILFFFYERVKGWNTTLSQINIFIFIIIVKKTTQSECQRYFQFKFHCFEVIEREIHGWIRCVL